MKITQIVMRFVCAFIVLMLCTTSSCTTDEPLPDLTKSATVEVSNITKTGFNISFNNAVSALAVADIAISPEVKVSGVFALSTDKKGYKIATGALTPGNAYTVSLSKTHFNFSPQSIKLTMPKEEDISVTASISLPTVSGFTVTFDKAVSELTSTDITLSQDATVNSVMVVDLDKKIYNVETSPLKTDATYSATITKDKYAFSPQPINFYVPVVEGTPVTATTSLINANGFTLTFDVAVAGFGATNISISPETTITSVTAVGIDKKMFRVVTSTLTPETAYTINLNKSGFNFKPQPLEITLPKLTDIEVTATVSLPTTTGFTITFDKAVSSFISTNIALSSEAKVTSVRAVGTDKKVYKVTTSVLKIGTTYTATLTKTGYTFTPQPLNIVVPSPDDITVTAAVSFPSTSGFTVTFNKSILGFSASNLSLTQGATITRVTVVGSESKVYKIETSALTASTTYTASLTKTGYSFTPQQLSVVVPAPLPTQVTASIIQPSLNGFTIRFNRAIVGFVGADITLSQGATITSVTPVGLQSIEYNVVTSTLTGGATYVATLTKTGFSFTPIPLNIVVPRPDDITVSATVSLPTTSGFIITFDKAVTGFAAANISLSQGATVTSVTAVGTDSKEYSVVTSTLASGTTYSATLTKTGFSFSPQQVNIVVPSISVNATVSATSASGFTVTFDKAVSGLLASNISLSGNASVTSLTMVGTDSKVYNITTSALTAGATYTATIAKTGYIFTPQPLSIVVPATTITASVSNTSTSGFTITFNEAVVGFVGADISLSPAATITSVTAVGIESKVYNIVTSTLTGGTTYAATLTKTGFSFTPQPLNIIVPKPDDISVSATVTLPSTTGFTITFDKAVTGFATANITLSQGATVTSVIAVGGESKVYNVVTSALTASTTYSATLAKSGFSFTPQQLSIVVPAAVLTSISQPTVNGFTITFDKAVVGFVGTDISLSPAATITSVTAVGIESKVYNIVTSTLTGGTTYAATLTKSGFSFTPQPLNIVIPKPDDITVSATASLPSATGFTITFDKSVTGFVAANITLSMGATVTSVTAVGSESKVYNVVTSTLSPGVNYSASIAKTGFSFTPQQLSIVLPNSTVTAFVTNASCSGFTISFDTSVVGFVGADISLSPATTITSVTAVGLESKVYNVATSTLIGGTTYNATITKTGYNFTPQPLSIVVPKTEINATISQPSTSGFTITFNKAVAGFAAANISLSPSATITSVTAVGSGSLVYNVATSLTGGASYATTLTKTGFTFSPQPLNFTVPAVAVTDVNATISQQSVAGFTITFDKSVVGFVGADISLSPAATITSVTAIGLESKVYNVTTTLTSGYTYAATLAKTGYNITPKPVNIVVSSTAINATVSQPSGSGFTITFDKAVSGFTAANISISPSVTVTSVTMVGSDSKVYNVVTSDLKTFSTYNATLTKTGYNFSPQPVSIFVPATAIVASISQPSTTGFKITFDKAVTGFDTSNISLSPSVTITSVTAVGSDMKVYDIVTDVLNAGGTYNATITKTGFTFSPQPLSIVVPNTAINATISQPSSSGFTITFDKSVIGFVGADISLSPSATITSVTAVGIESKVFNVVTTALTGGSTYTATLTKTGFTFSPKTLNVVVPNTAVTASISQPSTTGFTITFDKAVAGLVAANLTLTPSATITSVTASGSENKVFVVRATLVDNSTYSLVINKTGFNFSPQSLSITVPRATKDITATLSNTSNTGFRLTFNTAITEGLAIADLRLSSGTVSSVTVADSSNKIFNVVTSKLTSGATITVTLSKTYYNLTSQLVFKVPLSTAADLTSLKVGAELFVLQVPSAGGTTTLNNAPRTLHTAASSLPVVATVSAGARVSSPTNMNSVDFSAGRTVAFTVTAEDGITSKTYNFVITAYDATSNLYGIYTPRHLSDIRNALELTDKYILKNDIYLPDTNGYNDATDPAGMGIADYSTAGWAPIWNGTKNFFGTLDGNGKAIIGLSITRASTDAVGLFRATSSGATIKNLGVITTGSVRGNNWVGIITGNNEGGSTITHCYTKGSVIGAAKGAGGIAGLNYGSILNSYSTASVSGSVFRNGGIVGNGKSGAIINCYSTGPVSTSDDSVGGIVGYCEMSIITCYSTSRIPTYQAHRGGLVGFYNGGNNNIQNSYWDVETSLQPTSPWGGIGLTTAQMKAGIPYDDKWTSDNWTFTAGQYPKLVGVGGQ